MNTTLFWRAAGVQLLLVAIVFGVLVALPIGDDFFEDYGLIVGPLIWIGCSLITGRLLRLPIGFTLFCALAGAVAGIVVELAAPHPAAVVAAIAVFAASASGYDETADSPGQASTP